MSVPRGTRGAGLWLCVLAAATPLAVVAPAGATGPTLLPRVPLAARSISSGETAGCAVTVATAVVCWGDNGFGQLGDGSVTSTEVARPTVVASSNGAPLDHVRSVSAGWDHACAVLDSGAVDCWGSSTYGQLGIAASVTSKFHGVLPYAERVHGLGAGAVLSVSSGYEQTCALMAARDVECWGRNEFGQLGDGTFASSYLPRKVKGLSHVLEVVAGAEFSCALLASHAVACWGLNADGELGDATTAIDAKVPVTVPGVAGVASIAAGFADVCAVLDTHQVSCWGWNAYGQLGRPTTQLESSVPTVLDAIQGATSVTVGYGHVCALISDGSARCWGWDALGQLGNGRTGQQFPPSEVVALRHAAAVSAGFDFTCALERDATVTCFGDGGDGQLGDGAATLETDASSTHEVMAVVEG